MADPNLVLSSAYKQPASRSDPSDEADQARVTADFLPSKNSSIFFTELKI